jgi:formate hydrogenlyase subunit 6/NADH:ubiquinone oxidoreductase subunit I
MQMDTERRWVLSRENFPALLEALRAAGFRLIGPTLRDRAIVYDEIRRVEDLPAGWEDEQEAGRYRLRRRADAALFAYNVGPDSWKKFLQRPAVTLWEARRSGDGFVVETPDTPTPPLAFIGVRACELQAIGVQDRVLAGGAYPDPDYVRRRKPLFTVVVHCTRAGNTCFCASMGTGPRARGAFDLALTELVDGSRHEFLVEAGSQAGREILQRLPRRPATAADARDARAALERAAAHMGRRLEREGVRELLYGNAEHARWDTVATRCLACGNCTLVCPTCFCTAVEDDTDLAGETTTRIRRWDSCFTSQHSRVHGGVIHQSTRSRYRQWLTHKLASWHDQFGTSGCVGCGRCITWCPVGIDITEEVAAIRARDERDPAAGRTGS